MIRIHTYLESLFLEPEELRTYHIFGFCFLVQHAKRHYISEEQYHRETCPVYGTEECRTRPYGSFYRAMHFCIELTLKNGERYLIDAGSSIDNAAEAGEQLISRIKDSIVSREKLTVIDVCRLLDACDAPNDGAPARLIIGKEAEELLAQRSGRQAKFLRAKDWQISIDPFDCEISKTEAYFACHDEQRKEEGDEAEACPLKIGKGYYLRIRTRAETYLLLAGYQEEDCLRWLRRIGDWMAGDEPLLELTAAAPDGGVPRLLSRGETQELMRYLPDLGAGTGVQSV